MAIKSCRKMANLFAPLDVCQTIASETRHDHGSAIPSPGASKMMDVIMVALGLAFFAVSIAYTFACDRL